jgi:hypothetical protein
MVNDQQLWRGRGVRSAHRQAGRRARGIDWPPGATVYTYGFRPGDARQIPPPTRTTVLVARGTEQRWFDVSVCEVYPSADPAALLFDSEIIATLSKRAGNPSPFTL